MLCRLRKLPTSPAISNNTNGETTELTAHRQNWCTYGVPVEYTESELESLRSQGRCCVNNSQRHLHRKTL